MILINKIYRAIKHTSFIKRSLKTLSNDVIHPEKIRNIGILAHIDAGKTTTTERMLYYSGTIGNMGEVHHGNTVTDYMEQERQRGITIIAAAVSFPWNDHQFNLIDTPGHIDFTMEVEQSLGVLDGAVIILDGSAGVEAQTLTVWRQCDNHQIPRIIYINKMDKKESDNAMCLKSIEDKLEIKPLCLHIPVKNEEKKLVGIVDIVNLEYIVWNISDRGKSLMKHKLNEKNNSEVWEKAMTARRNITDTLSGHDDILAEKVIESDSLDNMDASILKKSIRKSTLEHKVIPILCGSSYKNIGVQLLMDSVIEYLPNPLERYQLYNCFGEKLCARAFKVQHDDQKGVLTYFRIFSGSMSKGQKLFNIPKNKSEQGGLLYIPYADDYQNTAIVTCGNVAVLSGLKATMTGDIVTSTQSSAEFAQKKLANCLTNEDDKQKLNIPPYMLNKNISDKPEENALILLGMGTTIPDPVFTCSIESPSLSYQVELDKALEELQREDPSLRVTYNEETGQTVLAGMGELHIEIIKQRILSEYKIDVDIGPLQIAYRETISSTYKDSYYIDKTISGQKHYAKITLSIYPIDSSAKNILKLDMSPDSAANVSSIWPKRIQLIKQGITSAFSFGPKLGGPVKDVGVTLHWLEVDRGTADPIISAVTTSCIRKLLNNSQSQILEPIMFLEIVTSEDFSSRILKDMTSRRGQVQDINLRGKNKVLHFLTPLSELMGYSSTLRKISSGTATFTMEFNSYQIMTPNEEENTIKCMRGF